MVFFTCNACGQSVKKNQVEKHYMFQCRECNSLTCMDCNKEFFGDEYKTHVKCITEDEKYGGKNYVAKPSSQKGVMKQEKWIERINSAVRSKRLSPMLSSLVEQLIGYENIPRRKDKFENFVRNSLKVRDSRIIGQVWELFSAAQEENGNITNGKDAGPSADRKESTECLKRNREVGDLTQNDVKRSRAEIGNDTGIQHPEKCLLETEESGNFRWRKTIKKLLKQQSDKTLSLKALRKNILAEYQSCLGSECVLTKEELKAVLLEKIKKCSKFELDGKYVKLL